MAFLLGKKLKMTQIWKDDVLVPATIVEAGPVVVTQVRRKGKDGYSAFQIGFDATKKKLTKSMSGHLAKLKEKNKELNINFRSLREFRSAEEDGYEEGDRITVAAFKEGERVKVSGTSKGRGFQGVVKRHGFHGGPKTHGQKNRHRAPGSIGATAPQRVLPGLRMAGRMGGERVSVKNLKIVAIDAERNLLFIEGALPGNTGSLLEISN